MGRIKKLFLQILFLVLLLLLATFTRKAPLLTQRPKNFEKDVLFGTANPSDKAIRPFTISIPDSSLQDLQTRLQLTRFPSSPHVQGITWEYGTNQAFMADLIDHWRSKYNWRIQEQRLNELMPQFMTNIDGLQIHFAHIKADRSKYQNVVPLLLIHGWPGSFFEFSKLVNSLTKPRNTVRAFDLIIPSLPGFSFSETPSLPGLSVTETAAIFIKLMARLNYPKYFVQGGDWGSYITVAVAQLDEKHCAGIHLNWFPQFGSPLLLPLRLAIGSLLPSLILPSPRDQSKIFPLSSTLKTLLESSGYLLEQATKPDTVGFFLADSPASLAAWITEKFYFWSHHEPQRMPFSHDDLLTNIMLYWLNTSGASSVRYYREFFQNPLSFASAAARVNVPTGLADFPVDLIRCPRDWVSYKYPNLVAYSEMEDGGHFAALENPYALASDIEAFVGKVISRDPLLSFKVAAAAQEGREGEGEEEEEERGFQKEEEKIPAQEEPVLPEEAAAPVVEEKIVPTQEEEAAQEAAQEAQEAAPAQEEAVPAQEEAAPVVEVVPVQEEAAPPQEEVLPTQEEAATPQEEPAPVVEVVPAQEEAAAPQGEVVPAQEAAPPQEEIAPAQEEAAVVEVVPVQEEVAPPQEEAAPPQEEAAPPQEETAPAQEEAAPAVHEEAATEYSAEQIPSNEAEKVPETAEIPAPVEESTPPPSPVEGAAAPAAQEEKEAVHQEALPETSPEVEAGPASESTAVEEPPAPAEETPSEPVPPPPGVSEIPAAEQVPSADAPTEAPIEALPDEVPAETETSVEEVTQEQQ